MHTVTSTRNAWEYHYPGTFDEELFKSFFRTQFATDPRYTDKALSSLVQLLGLIQEDPFITDIRWMAYLLATVFWETGQPIREQVRVITKKGIPLKDRKGHPVMRTVKRWVITMQPVAEIGHGRGYNYYLPVKVKALNDGSARVTEQDGHQFIVKASGAYKKVTKNAVMGSAPNKPATQAYDDDDGEELSYYGRGYVQLTWWSNYAKAGQSINLGLDLLLNPDKVQDPEIAYALMSHGMRTGEGFANKRKFADYFHGTVTNYVGARAMVNGKDHRDAIAAIARKFEFVLFVARSTNC